MKKIRTLANLLFVILMIIAIPLSIPKIFGFSIYSVLSDSMEPSISTGTIIYVKKGDVQTLKPGDIISFYGQEQMIITHRIVSIENQLITTKGDNNKDVDLTKVSMTNVIGKVMFSIPILGYVQQTFGNISGVVGLLIVLLSIMFLWVYTCSQEKGGRCL